jgi:hypothetical protein
LDLLIHSQPNFLTVYDGFTYEKRNYFLNRDMLKHKMAMYKKTSLMRGLNEEGITKDRPGPSMAHSDCLVALEKWMVLMSENG